MHVVARAGELLGVDVRSHTGSYENQACIAARFGDTRQQSKVDPLGQRARVADARGRQRADLRRTRRLSPRCIEQRVVDAVADLTHGARLEGFDLVP